MIRGARSRYSVTLLPKRSAAVLCASAATTSVLSGLSVTLQPAMNHRIIIAVVALVALGIVGVVFALKHAHDREIEELAARLLDCPRNRIDLVRSSDFRRQRHRRNIRAASVRARRHAHVQRP